VIVKTPAIICANRAHGEHGAIVRAMTPELGLVAGYVRGAKSRTMRPVLIAANEVMAEYRFRVEGQLPGMAVEPIKSRAPLFAEALAASALEWVTALTASALPEAHPYPAIYAALDGVVSAVEMAPSARRWAGAIGAYERLVMRSLGYGGEMQAMADDWNAVLATLQLNGVYLARHILADRKADILVARERMVARLKRAVA
jgi:DNA repair protein RecO (recombination protein O)